MSPKEMQFSGTDPSEVAALRPIGKWEIAPASFGWPAFDAIYLINLPERTDRKRELERELRRVGLLADDPRLVWIRAVRPTDAGAFPSVGARGCFLSHLACLQSSLERGHQRILILEDDVYFPRSRVDYLKRILERLKGLNWEIWYGGGNVWYEGRNITRELRAESNTPEVISIDPNMGVQTSHCMAFQGSAIEGLRDFFELILRRPRGHPEAGPMHVDGAYTVWRRINPAALTIATLPSVCAQRSSQSDIATAAWFDKTPLVRTGAAALRRLRNHLSR